MEYLLEMIDISKQFSGVRVLDKVQFKLRKGTVHALVGENGAGKSTLIKCLSGLYSMDEGGIYIDGEKQYFANIEQSIKKGIVVINQEIAPVLARSVMENIWLGREPIKYGFVDHRKMYSMTKELLGDLSIDNIDPREKIKKYSIAMQQMVAIAQALSFNAKIIVMDEPTSSLTKPEVDRLFEITIELRNRGVGIIYISHKMDEIKRIADDITVLRDGKRISTDNSQDVTIDEIINRMVGRELSHMFPKIDKKRIGDVVLKVENLTSPGSFQNVSFDLRRGEILGFAGLVGAGRTEVAESLFGMREKSGNVYINGKRVDIYNPTHALKNGMIMLTEDRRASGIIPMLSVGTNIVLANYDAYGNLFGFLKRRKMKSDIEEYMKKLEVKAYSSDTQMQNLSGGNQQKTLIARWLLVEPDILILDEPTRGIDVGAKAEIYELMSHLALAGKAILMISSELLEIVGMSDRVVVMREGHVMGISNIEDTNEEKIMNLAFKTL